MAVYALARQAPARRGRQACRRSRAGEGDRPVRRGASAERRGHGNRRGGRAAAGARASHRRHQDRPAQLGGAAGGRGVHDSRRADGRSRQADAAAGAQRGVVEPRVAAQRVRQQLLQPAADAPGARCRGCDRRPRDRVADRRLLSGRRARQDLGLHPRRRDRRFGGRVHRLRLRGQPDRLASGVRGAGDPRLLPGARAVADRAGAAPGRPEPSRAGSGGPGSRGRGGFGPGEARSGLAPGRRAAARRRGRGGPRGGTTGAGRSRTRGSC